MIEKLKVLLQCSSRKQKNGYFQNSSEEKVIFVAQPDGYDENGAKHVRPDDIDEISGKTWRSLILEYNTIYCKTEENPLNLHRAHELYEPRGESYKNIATDLYKKFGENFYIISDGWGIVPAKFYLPQYNIAFSTSAKPYQRRYKRCKKFEDIYCLKDKPEGDLVCIAFGSAHSFFKKLTKENQYQGQRYIFKYDEDIYEKKRYTWAYQCALDLIEDKKGNLYKDPKRASLL